MFLTKDQIFDEIAKCVKQGKLSERVVKFYCNGDITCSDFYINEHGIVEFRYLQVNDGEIWINRLATLQNDGWILEFCRALYREIYELIEPTDHNLF